MEALLNCHPDIVDSAVFGLPDIEETGNDLVAAYIVRKSSSLTEADVTEYVSNNASNFQQLRGGVFFVHRISKVSKSKKEA